MRPQSPRRDACFPMTSVSEWHLFAYMNDDEGEKDVNRVLAEWQLHDMLRWATTRGYDNILLTRSSEKTDFRKLRLT